MKTSFKLIKIEDMNHYNVLYAGKGAELVIEQGWIVATLEVKVEEKMENCRFLCISSNTSFHKPVPNGTLMRFDSYIVQSGRTSVMTYVEGTDARTNEIALSSFTTFVCTDENTKPIPHGFILKEPQTEKESEIRNKARLLQEFLKMNMRNKKN